MNASPELFVSLPTGVRLCYQTIGNPSDPAVVLITGAACSMLEWRDGMLALMSPVHNPHYLIRFDHRDTGLSTEFPVPGGYTVSDMADDVEGLVDHLGLASKGFHVVGGSMGGPLALMIAARRPQQVRSATLFFTSPGVSDELPPGEGPSRSVGMPPMPGGIGDQRQKYIEYGMSVFDALATQPPDEEERKDAQARVAQVTDRDMRGGTLYSKGPNHGAATFGRWTGLEMLKDIKCPATVIQAAKDPFFGVVHGEALARGIQGAEYVLWEDVGHELPWRVWPRLAEVFLRTWKRGEDEQARGSEV